VPEIRVASPEGAVVAAHRTLAPTPRLGGGRIAVFHNSKPNAGLLLDTVARRVARRAGMAVVEGGSKPNAAEAGDAEVLANLRLTADVVLTGSGD